MVAQQRWLPLFLDFISHLKIDSKEQGVCDLVPNGSQQRYLTNLCAGLDDGIRYFVCLKARQLGISTISLAIDLFWLMVHDGIQGALVTDDEGNREKFRILLDRYIASLPRGLRVGIRRHNRNVLQLNNGSVLDYLVAGKKKGNKTLGVSRALNFVHGTECSSWGSESGVATLIASLAQKHPDRLYMFESTARGFNLFYDMVIDAKKDKLTQRAFFIGWWSKEDYAFKKGSREYEHYWTGEFDDGELEKMELVKKKYGHIITPEQIAWHRWMRTVRITSEDMMSSEYPWDEAEAFVMSGRSFFPIKMVSAEIRDISESDVPFKAYRYHLGENFTSTRMEQVFTAAEADLRIWHEPVPGAVYVMGVDPAWGRSENKDRHAIEIYRCYADRLVQVAEYAVDDCETYQLAWVMCQLAGFYKDIWINLEINGPGNAVMQELKHLRQLFEKGMLKAPEGASDDFFSMVRWYLYHRPDSLSAGYVYGFSTTGNTKMVVMNQFRDNYSLRLVQINSIPLLHEMSRVVQEGSAIEATGRNKDDRTFASALANKAYVDWVRGSMINRGYTFEVGNAQDAMLKDRPQATLIGRIIGDHFAQAKQFREEAEHQAAWGDLAE